MFWTVSLRTNIKITATGAAVVMVCGGVALTAAPVGPNSDDRIVTTLAKAGHERQAQAPAARRRPPTGSSTTAARGRAGKRPVAPSSPAAAPTMAPAVPAAPAAPVAPVAPARPAAPATPASKTVEEPTIVLTKERLLALTAKNALGVAGNSETLAALIRADRLHLTLGGIDPPVHGVYKIRKSTLIQLAADGVLTLFGDSEGFRCLVESGRFEEFLKTEQGEPQGTT